MIEWLALVVLVPAVLVPLVLLFGFAGCNQIFGLDPTVVRTTIFQATLDRVAQHPNRTVVQRIEPVRLSDSGPNVAITVQRPPSGRLLIDAMFISRAADATDPTADPYDAADDLTPLLSEPLELLADPTQPLLELPKVRYALDNTQPLLIALDISTNGSVPFVVVAHSEATGFLGPAPPAPGDPPIHEASLPDRSPGYDSLARIYLVAQIDVIGDPDD